MDTITTLVEVTWSFFAVFLYCEFGRMVTSRFDKFHDKLQQCNWYSFSTEMQRLYLMFMMNAQQPVMIKGYANILCTRDTYKKVIFFFELIMLK